MGVCNSVNDNRKMRSNNQTKTQTATKTNQSVTQNTLTTKSSSTQKDDYLLPENLAKHDDITKYYKISSEFLGKGSSGVVCEGESSTGEKFAIKRIYKASLKSAHSVNKEAEFNLSINHPKIIKCFEIYEDLKSVSFVMELGEGGDLFDFIVNSPTGHVPLDASIDIGEQILETVAYLHTEKGIVHRDLKPENFMITINEHNQPIIKMIDFGLATYIPKDKSSLLTDYVGTPQYAAPEIIMHDSYDEKVDIWSIGVILFNMLTGYEPFRGESRSELNDQIKYKRINFSLIEDEPMRELVKKMLERNTRMRVSASEALEIIRNIKKEKDEMLMKEKNEEICKNKLKENNEKMNKADLDLFINAIGHNSNINSIAMVQ